MTAGVAFQDCHNNPLYSGVIRIVKEAGDIIHLDTNVYNRLIKPRRGLCVSVPVRMDDGHIEVFDGFRVHHSSTLGPCKGGIRFHPEVTMGETCALAFLMTLKNSLMRLPLGGAKGAVRCDPHNLSRKEKQALTRRYTSEISLFIGPEIDIPAPDVGTDAQVMAWMMDTYSHKMGWAVPGVVTGKPIEIGGSQGRVEATSRGAVFTIIEAAKKLKLSLNKETKVAIQGFGNVGYHCAKILSEMGCMIVAVSDVSGGIYSSKGLDVPALSQWISANQFLKGFKGADSITNEELLVLPVDVLIPAALAHQITSENASKVNCKILAEGANGPVTMEANTVLSDKGVFIIPDILANAGGVIVSYFEWVQGMQNFFWSEGEVNKKLHDILVDTFGRIFEIGKQHKVDMRKASYIDSLTNLSKAMLWRGFFP